jgi:hypothetical protein
MSKKMKKGVSKKRSYPPPTVADTKHFPCEGSCRFGFPDDVVVADASDAAPASYLSPNMLQQTLLPPPHPAYGLMHLAGKLKDDNHSCAAAHAMVSAIEIAMGHEERQSFALQLMLMLKTTLDMGNVEITVHGIPPLCDDVPMPSDEIVEGVNAGREAALAMIAL